jgi:hypothetical protein
MREDVMSRQVLVDVEELERLRRRVVELEEQLRLARGISAQFSETCEEAIQAGREFRKRAEEAEADLRAAQATERGLRGDLAKALHAGMAATLRSPDPAAIEKARQEERAALVAYLRAQDASLDDGWAIFYADAIEARSLKSTKET